jgi:predicted nucleic acid-binding protein
MTIVDTSVWVDHFNRKNAQLVQLLSDGKVLIHPFIIGELALGRIRNRSEVLYLLNALPCAKVADHDEVLDFIDSNHLVGVGIGWADAHLLASMKLSHAMMLTTDKAMLSAITRIGRLN